MEKNTELRTVESIKDHVYMIRGEQVMIDSDLADIYGYEVTYSHHLMLRI